jgi:hypothetical protein
MEKMKILMKEPSSGSAEFGLSLDFVNIIKVIIELLDCYSFGTVVHKTNISVILEISDI